MRVFISHVSEDGNAAAELAVAFEAHGHEVIVRDSSAAALGRADAMVVLISPQSIESPFVRREIEFALATPRFAERLFPVVIAEAADAPWILRRLKSYPAGSDLADTGRRIAETLEQTA